MWALTASTFSFKRALTIVPQTTDIEWRHLCYEGGETNTELFSKEEDDNLTQTELEENGKDVSRRCDVIDQNNNGHI